MYDTYIYASYGVTFIALAALAFVSLRQLQRSRAELARLEAARSPSADRTSA